MEYINLWKVLEELYNDVSKKGVTIPRELMADLKSTKTLMNIYKVDKTTLNISTDIEVYLAKIESSLLFLAETDLGKECADEWLERIYEARKKEFKDRPTIPSRFVAEVPKSEHWIRLKTSGLIGDKALKVLLAKFNLSSKKQEDEYLLIYGKKQNVQDFIKEVSKKIGKKR